MKRGEWTNNKKGGRIDNFDYLLIFILFIYLQRAVEMFIGEELKARIDSLISLVNNFEKNAENAPPAMVFFKQFDIYII